MTERFQTFVFEVAAATALTVMSMSPEERTLAEARVLRLSARGARRIAESCLRYAIKTENKAAEMIAP